VLSPSFTGEENEPPADFRRTPASFKLWFSFVPFAHPLCALRILHFIIPISVHRIFFPSTNFPTSIPRMVYQKSIYLCGMKNLSLKLDDDIFQETEKIVSKVKKNRNRYINEAIQLYNRLHQRRLLSQQLSKESKMVSGDSLAVLAEFEKITDGM
jgi:hypothetical protein